MKALIFKPIFVVFVVLTIAISICSADVEEKTELKEDDIVHVQTGLIISQDELKSSLKGSRVVYIGETHDNYRAHQVQLEVIKDLYKASSGKIAIGMEMFQRKSQKKIDKWLANKITEKEFLKTVWYPDWGFEYEYYRDILEFAKKKKVPVLALNANEETIDAIHEKGIDNLSPEEQKEIPEIDTTDKYHRQRVKAVFDVHKSGDVKGFEKFYTVQCLWEETMAKTVANYLASKKGKKRNVIVLAGKDHVRYGFGIPKRVFRRVKAPYSTILPVEITVPDNKKHNIMNVQPVEVPLNEADFLWMVNYVDPEINTVKLGVMVVKGPNGVVVHDVGEGSSAERTGIKKGDIIIDVDGTLIEEPFDLVYEIRNKKHGRPGKIKIMRDGNEMIIDIKYEMEFPDKGVEL